MKQKIHIYSRKQSGRPTSQYFRKLAIAHKHMMHLKELESSKIDPHVFLQPMPNILWLMHTISCMHQNAGKRLNFCGFVSRLDETNTQQHEQEYKHTKSNSRQRMIKPNAINIGSLDYFQVIWDTGASVSITYDSLDFIDDINPAPTGLKLKGLGSGLEIKGVGTVHWYLLTPDGSIRIFKLKAFLVPSSKTRLLSPQSYLQDDTSGDKRDRGGECWSGTEHSFVLKGHPTKKDMNVLYDEKNNLPISYGFNRAMLQDQELQINLCVTAEENQNLTPGQKELLKWHFKLSHISLVSVQTLLRSGRLGKGEAQRSLHRQAGKCILPKCASCQFGKARRRPTPGDLTTTDITVDGALKRGDLIPGAQVSIDHFICSTRGRLYTSRSKTSEHQMYSGGCIFVDHASKFIHVEHQVGMNSHETLKSKLKFETALSDFGVSVQHYHTDNAKAFQNADFIRELSTFRQTNTFAGVGAHHHNGVAERGIQTIMSMARTVLLHAALKWPEMSDPQIWPMAVDHAVYVYNRVPDPKTGLSPLDVLSGIKWQIERLHDMHVFGSPTYVLDPTLQDGKKLPRWSPRSRRGAFLGVSKLHSSSAPLILNLQTGSISPQYHCIFDDWFTTVNADDDTPVDPEDHPWSELFATSRFQFPFDEDEEIPNLHPDWQEEIALQQHQNFQQQHRQAHENIPLEIVQPMPDLVLPFIPQGPIIPRQEQRELPIVLPVPVPIINPIVNIQQIPNEQRELPIAPPNVPLVPPLAVLPVQHLQNQAFNPPRRSTRRTQGAPPLWQRDFHMNVAQFYVDTPSSDLVHTNMFVEAYVASTIDPDTLRYDQAVLDEDWSGFRDAMGIEISALENEGTWDVVKRSEAGTNKILPGTWTFRRKRHPDGRVKKLKARFCVRGDLQETFPQTYAPVVQWSTVRLLMYFALFFGYETRCIDFSNAFVQAKLDEPIYIHLPRGFYDENLRNEICLKLKRSLYGLKEAPRLFYLHLRDHLLARGFKMSLFDPCLFYSDGIILVCFVDDCILVGPKASTLQDTITDLRRDFLLTEEGELAEYLGIDITRNKTEHTFTLTQPGLIDRIIAATGMEGSNPDWIPATTTSLSKNETGAPYDESWNYASVVGMLLYLSTNSRPDIAYSVNQVARFTHAPKENHSRAIKKIVRYLKGSRDKGLIMRPQHHICLDCYVDADFAGLYGVEDPGDPISVKSRTGFVIMIGGCPLIWQSKLQSIIALSTTEAEYIALSQSMRQLLPMKQLVREMSEKLHLQNEFSVRTMSTVFEDNNGALLLAQGDAPKMTPRSKHIAIMYHWWRYHAERGATEVVKIDTKIQQADILTKGLARSTFEDLRLLLMGW